VGDNVLVSSGLGVRKPDAAIYYRALEHFGAEARNTFFTDDSVRNVEGAAAVGIHSHRIEWVQGVPQIDALEHAITAFAKRARS
jgi:FMN phosphatase YigB (HAD superfamily)